MARFRSVICLAGCLLVTATGARGQGIAVREIRQNLFSACVTGRDVAWVVGELGRIFRTADGGATWQRQDAGSTKPFLAVTCIDSERAWIGGKGAVLMRTADAGETWELLKPNTTKHIFDLAFLDASHGVAVGDWGLLMYTEDGGTRWTILGMPEDFVLSATAEDVGLEPDDTILYGVVFADDRHGWTVGEFGTILATRDGGRTWTQQQSPVESTLFGVHFDGAERGWAVGIDSVIIATTDGGATWRQVPAPFRERSFYDVAVSGRDGWIAGDSGTLLRTSDQGMSWQVEPLPIELAANWFRTVDLRENGQGLITGAEGLLFAVDAGRVRDLRRSPAPATAPAALRGPS
jgi:photosystem II stability/assembly factor-like uncharacterized protein